jgi:hypothetical protein
MNSMDCDTAIKMTIWLATATGAVGGLLIGFTLGVVLVFHGLDKRRRVGP